MTEAIFREDSYRRTLETKVVAATPAGIVLDATIFYPQGGGQPGDKGRLTLASGAAIAISDTRYDADRKTILHVPGEASPLPAAGETVALALDWPLRHARMRAHTALHLLSVVLPYPRHRRVGGRWRGAARF